MKILSKIKRKLGLKKGLRGKKNKQIEKNEQSAKTSSLEAIPPLVITSFEAIRHFEAFGGGFTATSEIAVLSDSSRKNYNSECLENQLKMLYLYIVKMSENGIYKKEGYAKIGEFFGVGKDLIQSRFVKLIESGYLVELKQMNRFYKIDKEWGA